MEEIVIKQAKRFARFWQKNIGSRGRGVSSERDLDNAEKEIENDIKKYSSGIKLGVEKYVDTKELAYALVHHEYTIEYMGDASAEFLVKNKILPISRFDVAYNLKKIQFIN